MESVVMILSIITVICYNGARHRHRVDESPSLTRGFYTENSLRFKSPDHMNFSTIIIAH